jgi:hypothetical protein
MFLQNFQSINQFHDTVPPQTDRLGQFAQIEFV